MGYMVELTVVEKLFFELVIGRRADQVVSRKRGKKLARGEMSKARPWG